MKSYSESVNFAVSKSVRRGLFYYLFYLLNSLVLVFITKIIIDVNYVNVVIV